MTLKPCPFCGAAAEEFCEETFAGATNYLVFCGTCEAEGPVMRERGAATDAWNARSAGPVSSGEGEPVAWQVVDNAGNRMLVDSHKAEADMWCSHYNTDKSRKMWLAP